MRRCRLALAGGFLVMIAAAVKGALPDPYAHSDKPLVGPCAPPVMEQAFWVEIDARPEVEIHVKAPEGVTLLDRTKPGKGRERARLYFRSDRGIRNGRIRIEAPGRAALSVPLRVLTYREDIEQQIRAVPGVAPAARKRGRSYYTDDMIAVAKANLAKYPELAKDLDRPTPFDKLPDERLFASLTSWNVPRQCYSNWPCPYCGEKIYEKSGFYPWQLRSSLPFKAACPLCKRTFPSNDYSKDDFTSGEFPDDGWGWDPGAGKQDDFAGWVAYYNHRVLWQAVGHDIRRLALRGLLLGDEEAGHRAAVLIARMAYVYPGMNTRWQQVRTKFRRPGRLLLDGNWERNDVLVPVCQAYDAVFDHLDKDARLVAFLRSKDPSIQSPADVKALVDTYLIQVFGWDWIRREVSGGNMGAREEDMAQFAVCADMGPVSDRWLEELFTHAYNSGTNRGGFDDEVLVNTMTREGPCFIGALGYAYGYLPSKSDMAEILRRVTSEKWKARANLYDERLYPKLRAEFDTWMDFVVAGRFGPCFGDDANPLGHAFPKGIPADLREAYERAYRQWPTDRLARALHRAGRRAPGLFEEDLWPRIEAQAAKAGPGPPPESRVLDGVGFVFLESRPRARSLAGRAGIALRYGYGWGHAHHDTLNIELFARGLSLTPELGYPCWTHPMGGTGHVAHHNTGMIDGQPQYKGNTSRGDLELFAPAPEASFADVSARPDGFPARVYRRAVCLADAPGDNVYLLDILRLAGGRTRTCCFHGPPFDDFRSSLAFGPAPDEKAPTSNIVEMQRAGADGDVWGDWKYQGKDARLRIRYLGAQGRRYVTARCAKTDIPPIRYLFAEDEKADGASEFVSLWEPYEGEPFIEKVERLPVAGAGPDEFAPVAVRVTLAGGQVDTFLYASRPGDLLRCGDIEFRGSFGYLSELNGRLRALHLVDGERLRKGDEGVADVPPAFRGRITAADYAARTITLDAPVPADLEPAGRLVYIRAGGHRTAYHVAGAPAPGNVLRLDLDGLIYRSRMMSRSRDRRHVVCETEPPIETTARYRFQPGYYNGAHLTGEDGKADYRVARVEGSNIFLDRPVDDKDFPDADGDGRRMVCIYDMGPGDEVTICRSVFKSFQPSAARRKGARPGTRDL